MRMIIWLVFLTQAMKSSWDHQTVAPLMVFGVATAIFLAGCWVLSKVVNYLERE